MSPHPVPFDPSTALRTGFAQDRHPSRGEREPVSHGQVVTSSAAPLAPQIPLSFQHLGVRRFTAFLAIVYFAQGFADLSSGLVNQPLQYLLKEDMGLTATESSSFWALIGLGWAVKPVYGLLSDFFPLFGYQRKSYLLLMSTLGISSWLTLSLFPHRYEFVLILLMLCAATLAFCDVMTDALMVETGRPLGLTGSFQAVQWAAISFALVLAQLAGGYLSAHAAPASVFLLSGLFPLMTFLATLVLVQEPSTTSSRAHAQATLLSLEQAMRSRTLWLVAGFLFFWNFSPALGTPLLYYETDVLHFSKVFIGVLGALSNAAGIVGALLFFFYCQRVSLDRLLRIAVVLGVLSTLGFIGLIGPQSGLIIFFFFGLITQLTHLTILDLAARSCPAHIEGTVFALLMSTLNIGKTGGTALGGWLYDHTGLIPLICVSAAFTTLCWLMVPFLSGKSDKQRSSRSESSPPHQDRQEQEENLG